MTHQCLSQPELLSFVMMVAEHFEMTIRSTLTFYTSAGTAFEWAFVEPGNQWCFKQEIDLS